MQGLTQQSSGTKPGVMDVLGFGEGREFKAELGLKKGVA